MSKPFCLFLCFVQDSEDGSKKKKGDGYRKKLKLDIAAAQAEANKVVQEPETSLIFPKDCHAVPLGGKRYAVVKTFNNAVYVNLREYYTMPHAGSRAMAGRKGINLTVENWERLYQRAKEIDVTVGEMKRMSK